jgi:6-phosphogluconate dehydrogenase
VKSGGKLVGYEKLEDFVQSIATPRAIIILVQAGKPVDAVIKQLAALLEPNDIICDGGNEWYANSERRAQELKPKNILYMAMGVSGPSAVQRLGVQWRHPRYSLSSLLCPLQVVRRVPATVRR